MQAGQQVWRRHSASPQRLFPATPGPSQQVPTDRSAAAIVVGDEDADVARHRFPPRARSAR
eukprot:11187247-Lingulodinium_polyedra.AAC.1